MVTLLIVDDEEIIREGLKGNIPWGDLGIAVLGTAADGEEALRMMKTGRPDIVLADIRMPGLDGLALARKLSIVAPDTKVILLTGYSDFNYAQQAIQVGVKDYLLKPVDPEQLVRCVTAWRDTVLQEREDHAEREAVQKQILESLPFLKNWFYTSLAGTATEGDIYQKLRFFNVNLDRGWFLTMVVTIETVALTSEEERHYRLYRIFKNIVNLLTDNLGIKVLPFFENAIFVITLSFPNGAAMRDLFETGYAAANMVKEFLDYNLKGSYTIGIGRPVRTPLDLERGYHEAAAACEHRFYLGENQIIAIEDVEPMNSRDHYREIDDKRLVAVIKVGNESEAVQIIGALFADLIERRVDIDTVKRAGWEIIVLTLRALRETGDPAGPFSDQDDPWLLVGKQTTVDQLRDCILDAVIQAIRFLAARRQNKIQKIVAHVKTMIAATYADDISLESVAAAVSLSPCYLSNIFSQEMKLTFKEYLIQTRLARAQDLLRDVTLKIYEVAGKVGYSDSRYFSQIFKKYLGVTPVQYRDLSS